MGVVPCLAHSLGTHPASHGQMTQSMAEEGGWESRGPDWCQALVGTPPDATPSVPDLAGDRHRDQDAHPLPQHGDHRPLPLTMQGMGGWKLGVAAGSPLLSPLPKLL